MDKILAFKFRVNFKLDYKFENVLKPSLNHPKICSYLHAYCLISCNLSFEKVEKSIFLNQKIKFSGAEKN